MATLIESLRFRPAAATGARFALDAGHGAQRLPVVPTLLTVTATIAVAAAAIVVHTNLDRMLTTPARFGQPWAFAVSATIDHEEGMRELAADPRVAAADLARQGELDATLPDGGTVQLKAIGIDGIGAPTSLVSRSGRAPVGTRRGRPRRRDDDEAGRGDRRPCRAVRSVRDELADGGRRGHRPARRQG